jgi:hypothetical protein
LDFLLSVMADPAATPRQRVKAAAVAARYKHAPAAAEPEAPPTVVVVEDKFGFKVDPELARAERLDMRIAQSLRENWFRCEKGSDEERAANEELAQIGKRRAERLARLQYPEGYTVEDLKKDRKRLEQLGKIERKKLTPKEDAEEAHLAVRVLNPKAVKEVNVLVVSIEMEWPTTRIAELDERVVGGDTLTAPEEAERQELRRRYPESAAQADRLDHRYRYWLRKEKEIAQKAGMGFSKALQAARDKCEALRDPTKIAYADLPSGLREKIRQLETLRFDKILTPEEADELEELHRRYPQRAGRIRNLVVRRLSDDELQRDYRRQLGLDPGPIEEDGWPRCRTPTGRMAAR